MTIQRSGEPGKSGSEIWIRGISTFTSSSPLVLVDGVERTFNQLDPEDIESFTILKDATYCCLWFWEQWCYFDKDQSQVGETPILCGLL